MKLYSIKGGLRASPFVDSLAINPLRSLAEFKEQVIGYINLEEVREMRKVEAPSENKEAEESRQR